MKGDVQTTHRHAPLTDLFCTGDATRRFYRCRLFPAVQIHKGTVKIKANFGTDPDKAFMYDPSRYETETESPTGFVEMPLDA